MNWKAFLVSLSWHLLWLGILFGCCTLGTISNRMRGGDHPTNWFKWEDQNCIGNKCRNSYGILLHNFEPRWICGIGYGSLLLLFINIWQSLSSNIWKIDILLRLFFAIISPLLLIISLYHEWCWYLVIITFIIWIILSFIFKQYLNSFMLRILLFILSTCLISLSLYVGWGAYMAIGRDVTNYKSRWGVFDFIIGRNQPNFTYFQRWSHDLCAMSLRGMLQTLPIGLLLYFLSYFDQNKNKYNNGFKNWEFALSGIGMGFVYDFGWRLTSNRLNWSQGTELGEATWGCYTYFVLIISVWTYHYDTNIKKYLCCCFKQKYDDNDNHDDYKWMELKYYDLIFHLIVWFILIIDIISCFFYGTPKRNTEDFRNWAQSEMGLVVSTISSIIIYFWFVIYYVIQRKKHKQNVGRLNEQRGTLMINDMVNNNDNDGSKEYDNKHFDVLILKETMCITDKYKLWCYIMYLIRILIIFFWICWFCIFIIVLSNYDSTYLGP